MPVGGGDKWLFLWVDHWFIHWIESFEIWLIQEQNKWVSLCASHWIIHSVDLFKNTDSFNNAATVLLGDAQWLCLIFVLNYFLIVFKMLPSCCTIRHLILFSYFLSLSELFFGGQQEKKKEKVRDRSDQFVSYINRMEQDLPLSYSQCISFCWEWQVITFLLLESAEWSVTNLHLL